MADPFSSFDIAGDHAGPVLNRPRQPCSCLATKKKGRPEATLPNFAVFEGVLAH